eukprot:COSAG02_NODE_14640_length_1250_cov_1.036427_2_plen_173_part_01
MGVAPAPEELPLPKFMGRVAQPLVPQTPPLQGSGGEDSFSIHEKLQLLAGGGPPPVPAHDQPTMVVPRNYDPDAPASVDLAAAAVPRNYDPDAPIPCPGRCAQKLQHRWRGALGAECGGTRGSRLVAAVVMPCGRSGRAACGLPPLPPPREARARPDGFVAKSRAGHTLSPAN